MTNPTTDTEAMELWHAAAEADHIHGPQAAAAIISASLQGYKARIEALEGALADLRAAPHPLFDEDYTVGDMIDNQAWIVLSHVASFIGQRDGIEFMERWQDAWADGKVQEGYFTPHRGVAAWIAAHCQLTPEARQTLDADHGA